MVDQFFRGILKLALSAVLAAVAGAVTLYQLAESNGGDPAPGHFGLAILVAVGGFFVVAFYAFRASERPSDPATKPAERSEADQVAFWQKDRNEWHAKWVEQRKARELAEHAYGLMWGKLTEVVGFEEAGKAKAEIEARLQWRPVE